MENESNKQLTPEEGSAESNSSLTCIPNHKPNLNDNNSLQSPKTAPISDKDIILREDEPEDSKPKWNKKHTVITLLSKDASDEKTNKNNEKTPMCINSNKLSKILTSNICLSSKDDSNIDKLPEVQPKNPTEDSKEQTKDSNKKLKAAKSDKTKLKTSKPIFKNKTNDNLECLNSINRSRSSSAGSTEKEEKCVIEKGNEKSTISKTPLLLKKMFLIKSGDTSETSGFEVDLDPDNSFVDRPASTPSEYDDSEEDVEFRRKPQSLKITFSQNLRNSFRLKRALSEPGQGHNHPTQPRRSNTLKTFTKALFQFHVPAITSYPPAPLLVEDPPSSEDGSDLEDVRPLTDPALLNGSSGNFGSAGTRSAPSTPQGVVCTSSGGLVEPQSQPCSPGCTSPSIQRSPSHSVFTKCEKASLKHLSTSTPVMTAQAQITEPPSPKTTKDPKVHTTSKARQKKFLRHFPNVEDDEKVLNHYSCALIGDILLQGHLYITKNYFAFYSNVFGYVTKLLIPVLTVESITKEKTARIIPNAVGIATSEDKHVFGSLMSRDNTLQYMRTVWQKAKSASPVIIEPEITEQDLDSSESGDGESGRDSPPIEIKPRFSLVKKIAIGKESLIVNPSEGLSCDKKSSKNLIKPLKLAISEFRKLPRQSLILFATTLLLILLFLSAAVLLYRISKIQNRYSLVLQDPGVAGNSEDLYSDLLNWQTQLHSKSAGAVHSFLDSNLDQIAKVRQSLEALSSLLIQNSGQTDQESTTKPLEDNSDAS